MNEDTIFEQANDVLSGSPATTDSKTKAFISKKREPIEAETPAASQLSPKENKDAGNLINTTKADNVTTQHINTGFPDSARLVSSGGDAYIGGSVSPNSRVRASIRPMTQFAADPFWLESTDRFAPVGNWTANLSILNNPVKLGTTDPSKAAWQIATQYQGMPDDDFFGYEYLPPKDLKESWWSAFMGDYAKSAAHIIADAPSALYGMLPTEGGLKESQKTAEQVAQENRSGEAGWGRAIDWLVKRAQEYVDFAEDLQPLDRSRGAEIFGVAGSGLASYSPVIVTAGMGTGGVIAGRLMSSLLAASDTLTTRDSVLKLGGTAEDAQRASWKHLGFIGATEALSGIVGKAVNGALVRAAINRGASRALTQTVGAVGGATIGGTLDAGVEAIQDIYGNIAAGKEGYEALYGWSREDWNTFYGTLLLAALRIPAGGEARAAGREFDRVANVDNGYLELAANLKQNLISSAEKNGVVVSDETKKRLDDLILEIYQNPEAIIDGDLRSVAQGFYDKIGSLDPDVVEKARLYVDEGRGDEISEEAMAEFDNRVRSQSWFKGLMPDQQAAVLGEMRGMAYVGAFFFGQDPKTIVIPNLESRTDTLVEVGGFMPFKNTVIVNPESFGIGYGESPYNRFIPRGKKTDEYSGNVRDSLNILLHEFSHANDWNMNQQTVNDIVGFIKWYTSAIEEVFGKKRAGQVAEAMYNRSQDPLVNNDMFAIGNRHNGAYTDVGNVTENRAQAVGKLLGKAKDYIGLTGKPAQFIQAAHAIMKGYDEINPIANGISEYLQALRDYVKANSDVIKRIRDSVPAEKMRSAIRSYVDGNEAIDWYGITPKTLEEFAKSASAPLDSDALEYVTKALGDVEISDFVDKAVREWDEAFGIRPLTKTEQIVNERENEIDGGLNPEENYELEDWSDDEDASNTLDSGIQEIKDIVESRRGKRKSEFQKKLDKKFNGKTLAESMDDFEKRLKSHKFVKFGTFLDFMRGIPSYLSALGGESLVKDFDLVSRQDKYVDEVQGMTDKLMGKLKGMFGGSTWKYEDYVRATSVPMYKIQYVNPVTREKETRVFSKRELMSGILYDEQPDSHDRIAMTVSIEEIKKYLDDFDIEFARALRDYLYTDFRKIPANVRGSEKVPVNYFPIMDSYEQEKGQTRIINDIGRKNVNDPVGLVDVLDVIGAYMSRVAGSKSGYFAAVRRLNSVLNYNAKAERVKHMTPADEEENMRLDKQSTAIKQEVRKRLGGDFERFNARIDDIISHKNEKALRETFASKISRNMIGTLLYGNIKQFAINAPQFLSFAGYKYNTLPGYMVGVVRALLDPARSIKLANENKTIVGRRKQYRYSEYMEKNLSANADNVMTYVSNWATKHHLSPIEAVSDFIIHIGGVLKKVLASPTIIGDYLGNVIGYAASYDAAVRALGSEEAARKDLSEFINTRQSTSNQATKGLMVRRANRQGAYGSLFSFTTEPTQKWGTIGQDINRVLSGDMPIGEATRDISAQVLTMASYVAIQSGYVMGILSSVFGVKFNDDDWEKIYDSVVRETVGQIAGVFGPLSNIAQSTLDEAFFGYNKNGLSIPALSEFEKQTRNIKKGKYDDALYSMMSALGIVVGLPRAASTVKGAERYLSGSGKEKKAGLWQAEGRSEAEANRCAGVKK